MFLVAALYLEKRSHYFTIPGVEGWDEARDATTYNGPRPVVAHPACGPWGSFVRHYRGGEGGPELAFRALEQVRAYGGVLEHPSGSAFWKAAGLPRRGAPADRFGGYTIAVRQVDWGHACAKPTWLYCVRVPRDAHETPPARKPTHWIGSVGGPGRGQRPPGVKAAHKRMRVATPPDFARYLCKLALASRVGTIEASRYYGPRS